MSTTPTTGHAALPADDDRRCHGHMATTALAMGTICHGQAQCLRCLRRTAPRDIAHIYTFITPPKFVGGQCPERKG